MPDSSQTVLYYVHDPMCSWCWGFRPVWNQLKQQFPGHIHLTRWVGGLAMDSDEPMPMDMRANLKATWQRIQQVIPGTQFNFDFWDKTTPRRSTYPACRAVICARELADKDEDMTLAIQQAYYLQAKNPSDLDTLTMAATSIGLEAAAFVNMMKSTELEQLFREELSKVHDIGVNSFPSLVLQQNTQLHRISLDYNEPSNMFDQIQRLLEP